MWVGRFSDDWLAGWLLAGHNVRRVIGGELFLKHFS
jgi:hypothetical protein